MREVIVTGKTVEEATEKACLELGLPREEVSIEILEMPTRKLFKSTPAKVKATADEAEAPAAEEKPAPQPVKAEAKKEAPKAPEKKPEAPKAEPAPVKEEAPAEEAAQDAPITEAQQAKLDAAVAYLKTVFAAMGAGEVTVTTSKQGEACIIRVEGDDVGMLIGHRGETMESLSYLASLVINRMEGPYVKLGLDVGGYRNKREDDLSALAKRIADRVIRTGCYYEMEPMNPYERHIIHTAIADIEGVRSESKGEGPTRHIVIYSTDPNASNLPDRDNARNTRGPRRDGSRGLRRDGRGPRRDGGRGPRSGGPHRDSRGPRRDGGRPYGGPRSSVPGREFADRPRDPNAQPMAPKTTERIHDGDDFAFGKIEF